MSFVDVLQHILHYSLHYLVPGVIAWVFYRAYWKKAWLILVATMLVDLDHLLVRPIFDPNRCGVGFHLLHSEYAIAFYILLLFFPKTRLIGIGLLLHMVTDSIDCLLM
jgi:hypothetical protein